MSVSSCASLHPTAIIDRSARIGSGTEIGPFVVVEPDVIIGRDCRIGAHATIKRFTQMGDRNHVSENVVLGGTPQDVKYRGEQSRVLIGDDNVFREGVTVSRSSQKDGETRIGNGNMLMAYVHVAHDCRLEDRVVMANNICLAGHIVIEEAAFISGGVVIHQFTRIGRQSMVGGNAKVTQDVLPFFLVDGVPARTCGLNLVGLRRSGLDASEMRALKTAFRVLFREEGGRSEKLTRLKEIESPCIDYLSAFIDRSERGFCPGERSGGGS